MVEEYVHIKEKLKVSVSYWISRKVIHGREYFYKQYTLNGRQHQEYIKKSELESTLSLYNEKKELKCRKREIEQEIDEMSPEERRNFRQEVKLYEKILAIQAPSDKSLMPNGEKRDSKSEIIISQILERLNIKYQYEVKVRTPISIRRPDFLLEGSLFYEHMGMLSDPSYKRDQNAKLAEYAMVGIHEGENLMITTEFQHLKTPYILWKLVKYRIVTARKVLRTFFRPASEY